MSDQAWHFIDRSGTLHGPITIPQLQSLVASGDITTDTQVWTDALGDNWIPAANVEGLFAPAAPSTPPPPPAPPAAPHLSSGLASPAHQAPPQPGLITPGSNPSTPTSQIQSHTPPTSSFAPQFQAANAQVATTPSPPTSPLITGGPTTQFLAGAKPKTPPQQAPASPLLNTSNQPTLLAGTQPNLASPQPSPNPYQSTAAPHSSPAPTQPTGEEIYPATIKKGGSLGFWAMLIIGGSLTIILGYLILGVKLVDIANPENLPQGATLYIGGGIILIGIGCIIAAAIVPYVYLYRAWKCLQPGGAKISAGLAVGLLFIPLFNIFWLFKAIGGLPKQWNNITASYQNTRHSPKLTMTVAMLLIFIPFIGIIMWLAQITKALNFMAALHTQQSKPPGAAISALGAPPKLY